MNKEVTIEESWKEKLKDFFETETFNTLISFIKDEYLSKKVFPAPRNLFKAFSLTPFPKVKVVILGQDPYHGDGQANGLSFSVPEGVPVPPSLKNIYKEIESDLGIKKDFSNGDLEQWASQGVLLLNAVLTVVASTPASHKGKGWEEFTDTVIKKISDEGEHVVFMLWGNFARGKRGLIDTTKHLVLEAPHPSPFSVHSGFFGCKHFSRCNEYLRKHEKEEIVW
jgi:uracil-DNA glycosylase